MLDEDNFSEGARGKHTDRCAEGSNLVLLAPDVVKVFPHSRSVNGATRLLIEAAGQARQT
ncbi:MAG: hypothetical protein HPY83_02410 [Anaerolineae bacterium]|nr:hypothetical protein [Anaerolineae bacterium]